MELPLEPGTRPGRLLALVTSACVVGGLAAAQQAELASPAPTDPVRVVPAVQLPAPAASAKALLYDNGPYITNTGIGCGGADVSELEPTLSTFGYPHDQLMGTRLADDFDISSCGWAIQELKWLAYQTTAPTAGSINGITINLYDDSPFNGGSSIAGDDTTNRFMSKAWTGVYRVATITPPDCTRAIIEVTGDMSFTGTLSPGDYWLSVACDGSPSLGSPMANPTVPWDSGDNGEQYTGLAWVPLTGGMGNGGVDFPFRLVGSIAGGNAYCTSKPSSIPGCTPTFSAPACTASVSAGSGTFDLIAGPTPGGGNPAIVIHTPHGPRSQPVQTGFGYLCINSPFYRAAEAVALPGGTPGTCSGAYVVDFGAYMANQTPGRGLAPGNTCDAQLWYRDSANPGGANFTNAVAFDLIP